MQSCTGSCDFELAAGVHGYHLAPCLVSKLFWETKLLVGKVTIVSEVAEFPKLQYSVWKCL